MRRTPVLLVWAALLVGLGVAAWLLAPAAAQPARPSTPAGAALDRLAERIPGAADATGWVVLVAPAGTAVDDPAFSAATTELITGLRTLPGVTAVVDPDAGGTVSADRRTAFVPVAVGRGVDPAAIPLDDLSGGPRAAGLRVELGGALAVPASTNVPLVLLAVASGMLAAVLLAGWVLGSAIGGLLAGVTGLIGSAVGTSGALLAAGPSGLTREGSGLIFLVGVAVGLPGAVVVLRSPATGRPAVLRGGGGAAAAAAALVTTGIGDVVVIGLAAAGVIVVVVLAVLTLLPALRDPAGARSPDENGPDRWAGWVSRHAVPALSAAVLALVAVIAGSAVVGSGGPPAPTGAADDLLTEAFGAGVTGPLLLTVAMAAPASMAAALPAVAAAARAVDGVALAAPGRVAADGTLGLVTVVPTSGPGAAATRDLVHRLRDLPVPDGVTVQVTGATAVAIDAADAYAAALVRYLAVAAALAAAVLFALLRPWPVAATSLVGTVLSVAAAILLVRAVIAVTGWPDGSSGLAVVVAAALLVGLVLDQAVRSAAVASGPGRSRLVGAGALIVAAVVVGGLAGPPLLAVTALTVATGVLLDAVAVRLILLPASGAHRARGAHSAAPESRRGGRHRGG